MSHFLLHDEGSSTSDDNNNGGSVVLDRLSSFSDDEHLLASNNPKKKAGRKKFQETRHPVYRGVRKRNSGKWVCEMREPNKKSRIWLGTYPTVEMAARAHDVAAIALRGRSACLNFADSAWRLPLPASTETKDIQKAAAEAAEAFRPSMQAYDFVRQTGSTSIMQVDKVHSSEDVNAKEKGVLSPEYNAFYMDEEELFSMPRLITSMAEGLMMSPPRIQSIDEEPQDHPIKLWSFSI